MKVREIEHDTVKMAWHLDHINRHLEHTPSAVTACIVQGLTEYAERVAQPLLDEIAAKELRIKKLEYAEKAVIRRGLIHNYMDDDEFEAALDDLQNVLEGVSGE